MPEFIEQTQWKSFLEAFSKRHDSRPTRLEVVGDVGAQRAHRVVVAIDERQRIGDHHLGPHADAHGRALFRVDGLRAQILLTQTHIDDMAAAQPVDDKSAPAEAKRQELYQELAVLTAPTPDQQS